MPTLSERVRLTNIQRFCLHDGPGIRTVVFMQGCPLRCRWCQNPECRASVPLLKYAAALCANCGNCAQVCPQACHRFDSGAHALIRRRCTCCGLCAEACPTRALEIVGATQSAESVVETLTRDAPFYETSGGGVTLSGGEPLAQPDATLSLLQLARARGIHTCVETCGYAAWPVFESLLGAVDLWLFDLKNADPAAHRAATGVSNRRILSNLSRLLDAGPPVILRLPIVPGCNTDRRSLTMLVELVAGFDQVREVHLMPYNALARSKFTALGLRYALAHTRPPPDDMLMRLKAEFQYCGKQVRIGG